jgi:RNA polymerase sigma-70 factor (ECF subfamily)
MNKNEVRETDLVTQALAGDSASFGLLYEHYLDEMYQFVFYKVKGRQEAEDLTEVVFLKAWQALDGNPPTKIPFRLWLYRIARNTVIDHYRTRRSQIDLEEAMEVPETADSPETLVVRRERVEELRDKLQMLNEDQQEVITCRFVMGLSHAETAVVMSRTEQAVRALQYRAITALRNLLTIEQVTASLPPYPNGNGNGNEKGSENTQEAHVANGRTLTKEESTHV